jgi:hypothetical protein
MAREPAASLLTKRLGTYTHEYNERDLSLYALGLGCTTGSLKYIYECHEDFAALPTFAVIPAHPVAFGVPLEQYIPNFDRVSMRLPQKSAALLPDLLQYHVQPTSPDQTQWPAQELACEYTI